MPFISAIVGAVTAIGSGIAAAGSIGAWVVGGAGFAATAINTALGIGLSMGLSALAGALGQKQQNAQPGEVSATLQVGGDIPRQVAFGRVALRGQLVFFATNGVANERLLQLFVLSDGWCDGLDAVWFGDKRQMIQPLAPDHGAVFKGYINEYGDTGFGDKRATIWFYDGRPGQAANPRPYAFAPDRAQPGDRYAGMAYVMVELINNDDTFDSMPDLLWELRGYRCHDPRKDVAFGGSGGHSLANPATWEFTRNPALHALAYLRGIQSEGQVLMGMDLADYDLLTETFMQAANIADEHVPLEAGGSEARYTASAVLTAREGDHRSALAPLVQALAGYLIERNGSFGLLAGAAQLPVVTITDGDIDWTRGVTWSGSRSRTERVNEVHGQFVDPSAQWQANSYPPVTSAIFSGEDGERLAVQLDFGAIISPTQAQRTARIRMRETRRQASGTITCGFHLLFLEAGDWITWASARYGTKLYRVVSRDLNPDDTVTLSLQEVGNEIYSWSPADEQPYLPAPGPSPQPPLPSTVSNFAVQPDVIAGADGASRPILRLSWDPIADTRIVAVIIEYREVDTIGATRVRDDSPWDGAFILDQPPTGRDYEFRASIVSIPARPTSWTPWIALTALRGARFMVDVPDIMARFRSELEWAGLISPGLLASVWNTSMAAASADGKVSASIRRIEQVNADQNGARAVLANQVETRFGDTNGRVTVVEQSVSTIEGSVAQLGIDVDAVYNEATASGQFKVTAGAGPGGPSAQIKMRAAATQGGALVDAGILIDVIGGVGRISLISGQVVFVDNSGANPFSPFAYSGGQWVMNADLLINGNAIITGTLTLLKVPSGVTGLLSAGTGTWVDMSTTQGQWTDYFAASFNPAYDGKFDFRFEYTGDAMSEWSNGVKTCSFRIVRRKGGVDTIVYGPVNFAQVQGFERFRWFVDQPGSGGVQYVCQHAYLGRANDSGSVSNPNLQRSRFFQLQGILLER